jgi:hypothetical protein
VPSYGELYTRRPFVCVCVCKKIQLHTAVYSPHFLFILHLFSLVRDVVRFRRVAADRRVIPSNFLHKRTHFFYVQQEDYT